MADVKIVFVVAIGVTVVFGLTALDLAGYFTANVVTPIIGPKIEKTTVPQFTTGACQTDYWWIFPTGGHHQMVKATFILRNSGMTNGHATVAFLSDGAQVGQSDFLVQAGQSEQKTGQFEVNDCQTHNYTAQIVGVG